jgi:hypothetical protein
MGQQEVIEILENSRRPISRIEIAERLKEDPNKISVILQKLVKHKEVQDFEINRQIAFKVFRCKRRMRLYYIRK